MRWRWRRDDGLSVIEESERRQCTQRGLEKSHISSDMGPERYEIKLYNYLKKKTLIKSYNYSKQKTLN